MKYRASVLFPVLLLFSACSVAPDGAVLLDETAWESALLEHREQKDEEFRTSSASPMAGTQYLKSEPTDRVWLTREEKTFELVYEEPAAAAVLVTKSGDVWRWSALEEGVTCRLDDEDLAEGALLEEPAAFVIDGMRLSFYPADERVTFIVFDADRPEKVAFEHLLYYLPEIRYAVDAQLILLDDPEPIELLTSRNLIKKFYRYAKIRFRLEGQEHELSAFKSRLSGEGSIGLFVPFRDATSGNETYGAGRFLEIDDPDGERFVLDFNRSFNPLCNYSPAYNCTVPPRENHLGAAIRAGEKTYPALIVPKPPHLSVVIPAFNEESRLPATLDAVRLYLAAQNYEWEVLVVNDGSRDRTSELVRAAGTTDARIRLLEYQANRGKGYAVRLGMTEARGKFRLFMDADNSTSIDHVESFLGCFEQGDQVVIGSRKAKGAEVQVHQPRWKELLGNLGNLWIQVWAVPGIKDTQAGFKLFSAEATAEVFSRLTTDRWAFDVEALAIARRRGFPIHEHPIRWVNDPVSKVLPGAYLEVLMDVVKVRFNLWRGLYD